MKKETMKEYWKRVNKERKEEMETVEKEYQEHLNKGKNGL